MTKKTSRTHLLDSNTCLTVHHITHVNLGQQVVFLYMDDPHVDLFPSFAVENKTRV